MFDSLSGHDRYLAAVELHCFDLYESNVEVQRTYRDRVRGPRRWCEHPGCEAPKRRVQAAGFCDRHAKYGTRLRRRDAFYQRQLALAPELAPRVVLVDDEPERKREPVIVDRRQMKLFGGGK